MTDKPSLIRHFNKLDEELFRQKVDVSNAVQQGLLQVFGERLLDNETFFKFINTLQRLRSKLDEAITGATKVNLFYKKNMDSLDTIIELSVAVSILDDFLSSNKPAKERLLGALQTINETSGEFFLSKIESRMCISDPKIFKGCIDKIIAYVQGHL